MRLDKFLSEAGAASRRELKRIIKSGRVTVDGRTVASPDMKISETAKIQLDGVVVTLQRGIVVMLHKPAGYVTSTADPRDRTVMELLPEEFRRLFPIGRLDKDTEGLLLFTDDGTLAHRLTAPNRQVEKEYYVETETPVEKADILAFAEGVELRDGTQCLPAEMTVSGKGCMVTLREGKYHQVRRMLAARGKYVTYLKRVREGALILGDLPIGQCRVLSAEEKKLLL